MHKWLTSRSRYVTYAALVLLASIALSPVVSRAQQKKQAVTLESLAARVQQLEDEKEILDLLIAYERTLDTRDWKAYSELFTKDGSWSGGSGTARGGPQAVYDLMTRGRGGRNAGAGGGGRNAAAGGGAAAGAPANPAPSGAAAGSAPARGGGRQAVIGWGSTYHIMSNFKIDVKGDTATASSRWTFISAARGPGINLAGRYEDILEREDGRWKFKQRVASNEVTAPAAPAAAAAAAPAAPAAR